SPEHRPPWFAAGFLQPDGAAISSGCTARASGESGADVALPPASSCGAACRGASDQAWVVAFPHAWGNPTVERRWCCKVCGSRTLEVLPRGISSLGNARRRPSRHLGLPIVVALR